MVREICKYRNGFVARYGGEEFAVILSRTSLEEAKDMAELVRTQIELKGIPHHSSEFADIVTASIGVASLIPNDDLSTGKLIQLADEALYAAKREGRNRTKASSELVEPAAIN